jgi:8-oxo-dGTP diphosphatase
MWTTCSCGQRHWGRYGAAGLLLTDPERTGVVLQKRSRRVHYGGTWSIPGGAIEGREGPVRAALREAYEESGVESDTVTVMDTIAGADHGDWRYTYVLATAERPDDPRLGTSWEADRTRWVDLDTVAGRKLHPGLRQDWPRLHDLLRGGVADRDLA